MLGKTLEAVVLVVEEDELQHGRLFRWKQFQGSCQRTMECSRPQQEQKIASLGRSEGYGDRMS